MRKLSLLFLFVSVFALWSCNDDNETIKIETATSFEGLLSDPESEYTTTAGEQVDEYYKKTTFSDPKGLVEFDHYYASWGFGGGFTYTNKTDVTTPGSYNLSAITASGKSGSVYLTANSSVFTPAILTNMQADKYQFKGAWVTNSVFAYLAVKDGNDGWGGVTKFGAGDWFKLEAVGYAINGTEVGRSEIYLADYRDGKTEVLNTWKWFDWTSIANAAYIDFEMTSTDTGEWGMNTPAYFCIDAITMIEK